MVALESMALSLAKTIVQKAAGAWIADQRTAEVSKKELLKPWFRRGGLTSVEHLLVERVCRGEWLDLIPEIPKEQVINESVMQSWGDDRTCRATVIRDILRGRLAPDSDPHGLRLRGARISGQLDLENLSTDVNLELTDCLLEDGVLARDARLASVRLIGCRIGLGGLAEGFIAAGRRCARRGQPDRCPHRRRA